MNLDQRLIKQISTVKALLALTVLGGLLIGIATVIQARLLSQTIDRVFLGSQPLGVVMPLLWSLLVVIFIRAVLTYISEVSASAAAVRVKQHLRGLLVHRLVELGPSYLQGERSGELVNTVTQGIEAVDAYFSQYLPQLVLAGLLPVAYLVVVFPLDPLSGVVLLLTGPLIPFFMFLIGSQSQKLTQTQWAALGRMSAYFLDTLQGLKTLKALGRSEEQAARIEEVSERYREVTMSMLRITFLSALALELLGTIGTALIAVQIGLRLLYGRVGFEAAFFILLLAPEFYQPLRALGLRFHASMTGVSAARRIFEVLEQPVNREPAPAAAAWNAAADSAVSFAEPPASEASNRLVIEFKDVSFTYPGRTQPALSHVSLHILPGQVTALVGPSGAGKSTVTQLLLGFCRPDQGVIEVNGRPLSRIIAESWRSQIAWVPQQPYLFNGTIAENLRLARAQAALPDLRRAAASAHLDEFIEGLPQGYDTPVGEGAARLSSGQAQRLALARAFLRDAPFLILDEPTAHLDVTQERLLQEAISRLCAGRTVLVIAHRLLTAAQAGTIIVLEEGRVVEIGRHHDLSQCGGAYARLVRANAGALYPGVYPGEAAAR